MIIHRISPQQVRAQLTNDQVRAVLKQSLDLPSGTQPLQGVPLLGMGYVKLYFRGGGWWDIYGYASDGSDIEAVITKLQQE